MTEYLGALSLMALCFAALGAWISRRLGKVADSYLSEKAKNLATKKDIGNLTRIVEDVKIEYSTLIETIRSRNSLKMAAIDKRLQVHQQAYTYWNEIISAYKNEPLLNSILEPALSHYNLNCLYLDATVSNKYHEMLYWASHYHDIVIECREGDELALKQKEDFLVLLKSMGNLIRMAVSLPSINEDQIQLSD